MRLPDYILRHFGEPRGQRLPALPQPPMRVAGTCPVCSRVVYMKKNFNRDEPEGRWWKGDYYHWLCATPDEEAEAVAYQNGWMHRSASSEVKVLAGNLPTEEYRYWIGSELAPGDSKWAMCRACRTSTYSKDQRVAHYKNPDFLVDGDQCSHRLRKAFDRMQTIRECIICKCDRHGYNKWGIPICAKGSCERDWKFGQTRWLLLEQELHRQKKVADVKQGKGIIKAYIDRSGEKPTTMNYCQACNMFVDNKDHYEEHRRRIIRGEILAD